MDFSVFELLKDDLLNIIDAAIPNKTQNGALRRQVIASVNTCMNRVAEGALTQKDDFQSLVNRAVSGDPLTPADLTAHGKGAPVSLPSSDLTIVP